MRTATLLAGFLLVAGALTVLPTAQAASIQPPVGIEFVQCFTEPCPPIVYCTVATTNAGAVQIDRSRSCQLTVTVHTLAMCEATEYTTEDVGPLHLRLEHCGPGNPMATDAAIVPVCQPRDIDLGVLAGISIDLYCHVTIGVIDGTRVCGFNGLDHRQYRYERAPVTLVVNYCTPRVDCVCGPPPADPSANAMADPFPECLVRCFPVDVPDGCDVRAATSGVVDLFGDDCTVDVEPAYDCVGAWGFDRHVAVGFVDATVRVCTGGPFPPGGIDLGDLVR